MIEQKICKVSGIVPGSVVRVPVDDNFVETAVDAVIENSTGKTVLCWVSGKQHLIPLESCRLIYAVTSGGKHFNTSGVVSNPRKKKGRNRQK